MTVPNANRGWHERGTNIFMLQCRCAWRCFASHSEQLAHISGMTHCGARLPCPLVLALALASLTAGCFLTLSLLAHLLLLRVSFALLTATSTHPVSYTSALSHSAHTAHTPHMTHHTALHFKRRTHTVGMCVHRRFAGAAGSHNTSLLPAL